MADKVDAEKLWQLWTDGQLSAYKNEWIAFRGGEVVDHGSELSDLVTPFLTEITTGSGPLFAFITLDPIQ